MSAIWGTVSFSSALPSDLGGKMSRPLQKYQIDAFQDRCSGQAYMGCGIQYITALAEKEVLPIYDQDRGLLFTADCYLDNRKQLLKELSPEDPAVPDGTLMYLGYLKWGMDCLTHFLGAFSMALYRTESQTLFLASDHTAGRCLYYYTHDDGVTFSTLLEPIRNVHTEIRKNQLFLKDFLCAPKMVPMLTAEDTPYEGVRKLSPGQYLEISPKGAQAHAYFHPQTEAFPALPKTAEDLGKTFLNLYRDCVEDAISTDRNIGIALSSGLDSSSAGVLAAQTLKKQNKLLYAFTYVPHEKTENSNRYRISDETRRVREIAEMYPNIRPCFLDHQGKNAFDSIPQELSELEIPFKAFVNMPNLLEIGREARKSGCRILLTGQCGNSTVSYGEFSNILYDAYAKRDFPRYLSLINHYGKNIHFSRKKLLKNSLKNFRDFRKDPILRYSLDNPFLTETILENYPVEERFHSGDRDRMERPYYSQEDYRELCFPAALLAYLGEVETKAGLITGLLFRDPTRDKRILQFCCRLPYQVFCYRGIPRWLIRGNFQGLLPPVILDQWQVRGIQNADWCIRIQRDWEQVAPVLQKTLQDSPFTEFLNQEAIASFFRSADENPQSIDPMQLKYLVFLYTASLSFH